MYVITWKRVCDNCGYEKPLKRTQGIPRPTVTKFQCPECGNIGLRAVRCYKDGSFRPFSSENLAILQCEANGYTEKEIAKAFNITTRAVWQRFWRMRNRVGALNTVHLVAIAFRRGWIQ